MTAWLHHSSLMAKQNSENLMVAGKQREEGPGTRYSLPRHASNGLFPSTGSLLATIHSALNPSLWKLFNNSTTIWELNQHTRLLGGPLISKSCTSLRSGLPNLTPSLSLGSLYTQNSLGEEMGVPSLHVGDQGRDGALRGKPSHHPHPPTSFKGSGVSQTPWFRASCQRSNHPLGLAASLHVS